LDFSNKSTYGRKTKRGRKKSRFTPNIPGGILSDGSGYITTEPNTIKKINDLLNIQGMAPSRNKDPNQRKRYTTTLKVNSPSPIKNAMKRKRRTVHPDDEEEVSD
jgi:hypothetical protein